MILDFVLLADDAAAEGRKLYIHGGGLRRIEAPVIPVATHLAIAARFTAELAEAGDRHRLGTRLMGRRGEQIVAFPDVPIVIPPRDELGEDWEEISVATVLNFPAIVFFEEGWHTFRIDLDGEHLRDLRLRITRSFPATNTGEADDDLQLSS